MSYTSSPANLEIIEGLLSVFRKNQIVRVELKDGANTESNIHPALSQAPLTVLVSLVMLELDAAFSRNVHLREAKLYAALSQDPTLSGGLRGFFLLRHSALLLSQTVVSVPFWNRNVKVPLPCTITQSTTSRQSISSKYSSGRSLFFSREINAPIASALARFSVSLS